MGPETRIPFAVGQLVELVNQPPNYGHTLDGTLARVEWVPRLWDGSVIVEYYRRHRRTGKPLALRTSLLSVDQLRPIAEPTQEQAELLEQVEPLRREQQARRRQMKEDRLAWEQGILSLADREAEAPESMKWNIKTLASEGIAMLESQLTEQPPDGITAAEVAAVFRLRRERLQDTLAALLEDIAQKMSPQP